MAKIRGAERLIKMNRIERKLIRYLKVNCYGKDKAIRKNNLSMILKMTTRDLRAMKRDIVINYRVPIGSYKKGYFYARNDEEINICKNYYLSLIGKHIKVIRAYEKMLRKGQLKLDIGV